MAGCFTLVLYLLAAFLTLLVPLALSSMVSYAPIQLVSAVSCWLVPVGFFSSFWLGRQALFKAFPELERQKVEFEETMPMTKAQRVVLVWLTVDALVLFIWLSLAMTFGQVEGWTALFLALVIVGVAFLSAIIGYVLGYVPLTDQRKLVVVGGAFFSVFSGAGFLYILFASWQGDPLVRWGAVIGTLVSLLTMYYFHRRWDPAALEMLAHARVERYLDVLILTNSCFRLLYIAAFVGGWILLNAIGEQFALMVVSAWLSTLFGYTSAQAWRHRPPINKGSIYKSGSE